MYKVMIIDDERAIRNLLKRLIDWEELGLEVAGEAASGIEAINIIDEVQPDIAFVDIKMPFMDGIEFSKLAINQYPNLKVIILTAFGDFDYARECIGVGVCDYLLKPIVRTEIQETLHRIINRLETEPRKERENEITYQESNTTHKIKEYINKNYIKADLNLTSIAQVFGFNPSYLSRLFKVESGMNLSDYLLKCRIEKAMEYAKKGSLMYITAKMVGIPDPNYFGKCFKKYTGESYSDFIKDKCDQNL
ncbi:MAG: response regulator [Epulopiscium sp.]|nr:response regulator [Candidatus Epulonipiscium sp.]